MQPCPLVPHTGKPCGKCRVCQKARTSKAHRIQWGLEEPEPETPKPSSLDMRRKLQPATPPRLTGAGSELKKLFAKAGFQEQTNCRCTEQAKLMDENGLEWCSQNVDSIVDAVIDNAKQLEEKHGAYARLKAAAKLIVKEPRLACNLACQTNERERIRAIVLEAIRRAEEREVVWISNVDLATHVQNFIGLLPVESIGCVVGLPRSGLIPASQLAALLHVPLYQLDREHGLVKLGEGSRCNNLHRSGVPLIIDDSVHSGRAMRRAKQAYAASEKPDNGIDWDEPLWSAMYVNPDSRDSVDVYYRRVRAPHYFGWNLTNSGMLKRCILDFDGILCHDIRPEDDDDGERYELALANAQPLWVCRKNSIEKIVTARLERYRPETEAWLARHGMSCKSLVMGPWESKAERTGQDIGAWKAEHYAASDFPVFVESDNRQARRIFELTGRPVICPAYGVHQ